MKKESVNNISSEVLAAFLDGNTSVAESQNILHALSQDAGLREVLRVSQLVDEELEVVPQECEFIPMTAMAATCNEENYCSLECEKYVLSKLGIEFDEQQLLQNAIHNGWQKEQGTALHNIGRHLEDAGLVVERRYKCNITDIATALTSNQYVIVAINGGKLLDNSESERLKDVYKDENPDHSVIVLSCNIEDNTITVYDPNSMHLHDVYPIEHFTNAWVDSKNYMVTATTEEQAVYVPHLIDLSDVELGEELIELREAIAEHAHNVWAAERQAQGWTYGPERNDDLKQTPCMVPYSKLPDSEKTFDRDMAMNTIKLLKKLGWDLMKRK